MKDDVFIDTNLWIYLYSEKGKGEKVAAKPYFLRICKVAK